MADTRTGSLGYGDLLGLPLAIGVSWAPALARRRRTTSRILLPGSRRHAGAHRRTKDGLPPPDPSCAPAPHA